VTLAGNRTACKPASQARLSLLNMAGQLSLQPHAESRMQPGLTLPGFQTVSPPPGMQLSPHTVSPGTGVELPGQPAPFAAEMAGPAQHNTKHRKPTISHKAPSTP